MTDIVERLRTRDREWDRAMDANFTADDALLVQDAADEIERLSEMLTKIWVAYQDDEGIRKIYRDAGRENDRERG